MVEAPHTFDPDTFADAGRERWDAQVDRGGSTQVREEGGGTQASGTERRQPSFGVTLFTVLLPWGSPRSARPWSTSSSTTNTDGSGGLRRRGDPPLALLIVVIVGMITLGWVLHHTRKHLTIAIELDCCWSPE